MIVHISISSLFFFFFKKEAKKKKFTNHASHENTNVLLKFRQRSLFTFYAMQKKKKSLAQL